MKTFTAAIIVPAILSLAACGSEPSPNEIVKVKVIERPVPVIVEKEVEKEVIVEKEAEIKRCLVVISYHSHYKKYRTFLGHYTSDKKHAYAFEKSYAEELADFENKRGRSASTECP